MSTTKKPDTQLVTGGRRKAWTNGIVNPPVYRASTCIFESFDELQERLADPSARKLFYGRKGTPTQWALEDALTEMENGAGTMLFPSGIAAVTAAILAVVKAGDHILVTDSAYDPTRSFATGFLKDMGIETTFYDPLVGADIAKLFKANTRLVVAESPGSLTFEVQDLPAIIGAAKSRDIYVMVDNTWATPLFLKPLDLGADISVHACTKYIGGHSDVMLGSATANARTFKKLQRVSYQLGQTTSPDDAYLALRGLRTLGVRLRQHQENALKVAEWLAQRPEVDRILHPAFNDCPGHEVWARDFTGASGLFSIVLKKGKHADTAALVDGRRYFKIGFSWGGYESLILPSNPASARTAVKWEAPGPLVRLHIGLEDPDDLIADLKDGLDAYRDRVGR